MMKHTATALLILLTACTFEVTDETAPYDDEHEEELEPERPEVHDGGPVGSGIDCGYQEYGDTFVLPLECDRRPEKALGTGPVEDELIAFPDIEAQ